MTALADHVRNLEGRVDDFDAQVDILFSLLGSPVDIQLAPDGVVAYGYPSPIELGVDVLSGRAQNASTVLAFNSHRMILGPVSLPRGGQTLLLSLFYGRLGNEVFWGCFSTFTA